MKHLHVNGTEVTTADAYAADAISYTMVIRRWLYLQVYCLGMIGFTPLWNWTLQWNWF